MRRVNPLGRIARVHNQQKLRDNRPIIVRRMIGPDAVFPIFNLHFKLRKRIGRSSFHGDDCNGPGKIDGR